LKQKRVKTGSLEDVSESFFVLSWTAGSNNNPVRLVMHNIINQKFPAFFRTEEIMDFDVCNVIKAGRISGEFAEI
jgi:hypothetical protein